ncbi:signal recognition particle-docking protein FtsY [Mycobacterium ulcerans]|uniref:Signal recognition particle receptor FtsY n=1 Tax=Mycobacterium ulcerans (strain Agy99) TaxID=362242 RepID=A0PQ52_MYCUA|nr:signal recognition particle-docking protein FtsY [Mycobacterium ulcerans]ABL04471.1 cell division protein FtsY [Mycobacterium ulcerans Agy99]MEB3904866.1 signal recognition particle-docking protein FtsY [Mycobacterium ulcerans]MEB3909019.1 signal recognition particle-docking protein FtsY [Mycobacterium ulcerans]MEB3919258.1 signal recognition particle-docking protein FtsY [Mycobacterium ulcerans]MEB3923381.1 signal recognition particle-docking protein FtsY [Mycobacterium ulcerans]
MSEGLWVAIAVIAALLVIVALVVGLLRYRRRRISLAARPEVESKDRSGGYTASSGITFSQTPTTTEPADRIDTSGLPAVGDDATIPRDAPKRTISEVHLPEIEPEPETPAPVAAEPVAPPVAPETPQAPEVPEAPEAPEAPEVAEAEVIEPPEGRLERLRGRLAKSQNALGRSVLGLIGGGDLDEDSWQDVEDTLLVADLGPVVTEAVVSQLRSRLASGNVRSEDDARAVLRDVLIKALQPDMDRSIRALPHPDHPSVLLVVGVNGTGKTTTVGKLARVLVADGRRVVLGAADTFRAAAAVQLQTWAARVGAEVVSGAEGADPASVAFDAVDKGVAAGADVILIDTAGRLHTKVGLMDELGKVKRLVTRRAAVDEVLLVLDATIGQNGLAQAKVFAEVVDITGVVLTKLDGTAKGGIVFRVQQELGVPVKLVGLGEGPDDLAPFEPVAFVDALLG